MSKIDQLVTQLNARQLSRRQFVGKAAGAGLSAVAAGAVIGSTHAASAKAQTPPPNRKPTTVTIWTWRSLDPGVWEKAAEQLQSTWPGLKADVQVSDANEFETVVSTAMQGGQGPDIITARAGDAYYKPYAEANMYVPLADKVPGLSNIPESAVNQVSYQGEVLAVPFASQIRFFFYNKKIFDKYELTPPATWEELISTYETLKKNDVTPLFAPLRQGSAMSGWFDCIGATYLGDEYVAQMFKGEKTFTDEKFVNLLKRIKSLQPYLQKGYTGNNDDDMNQAFQSGPAATIIYGGWQSQTYTEQTPDLEFDNFLSPPDDASSQAASYVFVDGGYAVNAASDVKDAALEFVKYSATTEFGQIFANVTGQMSSIPGVVAPADNVHLQRQLDLSQKAIKNLFRIRGPFDSGTPGISMLLAPLIQGMMADQVSPEDVAQQLQEGISQWYKPFQNA